MTDTWPPSGPPTPPSSFPPAAPGYPQSGPAHLGGPPARGNAPPGAAPRSAPPRGPAIGALGSRLVLLLMFVLAIYAGPRLVQEYQYRATLGRELAEVEASRQAAASLKDTTEAFRYVAQSVGPSVVHIDTEQFVRGDGRSTGWGNMPLQRRSGTGSGVIVDPEGYILTNYHVVAGVDSAGLSVRLSDGRVISRATVVGADEATDLAVLKINAENLIAAPWGDSDELKVGDWVLAVGNPFGLDRTVTAGIVSAKGRRGIVDGSLFQDFLQTDAAVNPGNSGGPLANLNGEIVGINTAIVGQSFQGISFAIPSHMARDVYEKLRESGSVERAWLGAALQDLTPELAAELNIDALQGVVIARIVPGAPADEAGLQPGDVVVALEGEDIHHSTELALKVAGSKIGSTVKLKVLRGEQELTISVKLEPRPPENSLRPRSR
ncbi:MAG: S1C family serine protease [Pirellulales bacterium]